MEHRVISAWKEVFSYSWPVMVEQTLRTGMRTTDIVVTGLFSPAAVAAVGLADLYARLPLRIGLGLGSGVIALSSQDTGSGARASRDDVISQALLMGIAAGLPFMLLGILFGDLLIGVLGAESEVIELSAVYLAIILVTAPARHVALIAARAIQGAGDTRTPMWVNLISNGLNISGTILLGLGPGPFPEWHIVGVGMATAFGNVFTATMLVIALWRPWTPAGLGWPRRFVLTRQLFWISLPRIGEGFTGFLLSFPFNAILLVFGTPVNAAYHIGRRVYQQVTSPLARGYRTGTSIVVGQALGRGQGEEARFKGWSAAGLGVLTVGSVGAVLFVVIHPLVSLFESDPVTLHHAVQFGRTYAAIAPLTVLFVIFSGALTAGSDTTTPFLARLSGMTAGLVIVPGVGGLLFDIGPPAAYAGIAVYFGIAMIITAVGFYREGWIARTEGLMVERGSLQKPDLEKHTSGE